MLTAGKLVEALRELSRWYGHPAVQPDEQAALVELLGQLAGSVIYSSQHWLLPAYAVRSGDTLESIAAQYDLPWQILAKINGIKNPSELTPGRELKVIRGPFQGQLDLSQQWLTVFVDGMYAGRFRVDARGQINKPEGWYPVVKFTAGNSPGTAATGPRHITVGGDIQLLCPEEAGTGTPGSWLGAIHIARPDMDDVFDILSERSQVTIRR
jgi:LysM repeat protein